MQNSDKASTSISLAGSGQLVKMHVTLDFCLIWFFTSHQQSFIYKGTGLPGLNQY